jgi:hypothetical protein
MRCTELVEVYDGKWQMFEDRRGKWNADNADLHRFFGHGTTILYSHALSFAMLKLMLKPALWFELNFIHG